MNLPEPMNDYTIVEIRGYFIGDKLEIPQELICDVESSEKFIKNRIDVSQLVVSVNNTTIHENTRMFVVNRKDLIK